jgi:ribosomal protein L40E
MIFTMQGRPHNRSTSESGGVSAASAVSVVAALATANGARQRGIGLSVGLGDVEQGQETEPKYMTEADEDEELLLHPNRVKYCRKCKEKKPPRAHHCHVCGRCVLKMGKDINERTSTCTLLWRVSMHVQTITVRGSALALVTIMYVDEYDEYACTK